MKYLYKDQHAFDPLVMETEHSSLNTTNPEESNIGFNPKPLEIK